MSSRGMFNINVVKKKITYKVCVAKVALFFLVQKDKLITTLHSCFTIILETYTAYSPLKPKFKDMI